MTFHPAQALSALKEKLFHNDFIKSVLTLSSGIAVAQAIALLTTPVVSRIYDTAAIGDFSLIVSSASIMSTVVCLSLLSAIMLPKKDEEAQSICTTILISVVVGMTVILAVLLLLADQWQLFHVAANYRASCIVLYVYVILSNVSALYYAYTNRQKLYKVLFWNPMLGTVSNALISVVLGLLGWGMVGYALGNLTALLINILHMRRHVHPFSFAQGNPFAILKKYKAFPLFQLPSNLIGTMAQQIPIQMISFLFGTATLGIYSMCMTILKLPSRFLAGPVNQVFYREAAKRYSDGENIGDFVFSIMKTNIKLALLPIAILTIFGEPLFALVLGEKWRMAGQFAAILSIYEVMAFCNSCLSGKLTIINKQKANLFLSIIGLVLFSISFIVGNAFFPSVVGTLTVYAICGALFELFDTGLFIKLSGMSMKHYSSFVLKYLVLPMSIIYTLRYGFLTLCLT